MITPAMLSKISACTHDHIEVIYMPQEAFKGEPPEVGQALLVVPRERSAFHKCIDCGAALYVPMIVTIFPTGIDAISDHYKALESAKIPT